jgi:hypothetical protein
MMNMIGWLGGSLGTYSLGALVARKTLTMSVGFSSSAVIYLAAHYLLVVLLGRWSTDFVNNQPNLTAVAAS